MFIRLAYWGILIKIIMAKHVKDCLSDILSTSDWKAKLLAHWPQVIGDLNEHVQLEKIQDHQLVLGVYNSSWMHELYMLSPYIMDKINEQLDMPRIKNISFKMASPKRTKKYSWSFKKNYKIDMPKRELSVRELKALGVIQDEQLAQSLKLFLQRCDYVNKQGQKQYEKK